MARIEIKLDNGKVVRIEQTRSSEDLSSLATGTLAAFRMQNLSQDDMILLLSFMLNLVCKLKEIDEGLEGSDIYASCIGTALVKIRGASAEEAEEVRDYIDRQLIPHPEELD